MKQGALLRTDYIKRSYPAVVDAGTCSLFPPFLAFRPLAVAAVLTMFSKKDTDIHKLVKLFSAMNLEDNLIQDGNIEAAGQSFSHINSAQTSTTVEAMDIDTEEPAPAVRSYCKPFLETSQPSLGRNWPPNQGIIRRESRLSAIVRPDAMAFFRDNREEGLKEWLLLLQVTTFPRTITSSDPRILEAFTALEGAITGSQVSHTLSRFAHFRLIQLFSFLKSVVKSEREKGQVCGERGRRNASYALDVYQSAHPLTVKRKLIDRMRLSRRWKTLAGPSPFFLMIYSCTAQAVV